MNILPGLNITGAVKDHHNIAIKLYEYFLVSDFSQSNIYKGHIASLKYLIAKYQHDEEEFVFNVAATLRTLFGRYFESASCEADFKLDDNSRGIATLHIVVEYVYSKNGQTHKSSLSKAISIDLEKQTIKNINEDLLNLVGTHNENN